MRIPILYIPHYNIKRFFYIERRFKYIKPIIPVGCDCHPAYTLDYLNIRTKSLPFDWLNMDPVKSLDYVTKNLKYDFSDFLSDMTKNKNGYYVSSVYPETEFMHEKDMLSSSAITKFKRRISRLLNIIREEEVVFLHNLPVDALDNEEDVDLYCNNVREFLENMKEGDSLKIYLRFDEDLQDNELLVNKLLEKLNVFNVKVVKYLRRYKEFGTWGNTKDYIPLFESLGIHVVETFPRFYIK